LNLVESLKLIRVKHWVKNGLIFLPIFFSGKIELIYSVPVLSAFILFCFTSSSVYILNDLKDLDHDRVNPNKVHRPLASGSISKREAWVIFSLLISSILLISVFFFNSSFIFIYGYFVLNLLYTYWLKRIAVIDVTCISLGFVLRILAGSIAASIFLTHWMIIMVFLLMISMAFAKRRDDFKVQIDSKLERESKSGYSLQFLDMATSLSFAITLVAYILYTVSPEVINRIGTDKLYVTALFVFLGVMRYLQLSIVFEKSSSPVKLLFSDRFLQLVILAWLITFAFIIYGKHIELGIFS